MKVIIGVSGVKESGKSTFARILKEQSSMFEERSIAFKLKETCASVTGLTFSYFEDQDLKKKVLDSPIILTSSMIESILEKFEIPVDERGYRLTKEFMNMSFETTRKMLQVVGTELLRSFDEEIHCNYLAKTLNKFSVISDVRFENEYFYFGSMTNTIYIPVFIHNDEAEEKAKLDGHRSEMEVFTFSDKLHLIDNNKKSITEMEQHVKKILAMTDFAIEESKRDGVWI